MSEPNPSTFIEQFSLSASVSKSRTGPRTEHSVQQSGSTFSRELSRASDSATAHRGKAASDHRERSASTDHSSDRTRSPRHSRNSDDSTSSAQRTSSAKQPRAGDASRHEQAAEGRQSTHEAQDNTRVGIESDNHQADPSEVQANSPGASIEEATANVTQLSELEEVTNGVQQSTDGVVDQSDAVEQGLIPGSDSLTDTSLTAQTETGVSAEVKSASAETAIGVEESIPVTLGHLDPDQSAIGEESLTPGLLASRRAHLFGNVSTRAQGNLTPSHAPVRNATAGADITDSTLHGASLSLTPVNEGLLNSGSGSADAMAPGAATAAAGVLGASRTVTGDLSENQMAARQLKEAELKALSDQDARASALKAEQQSMQANLAQSRQLAQLAAQNLNPLHTVAANESGGGDKATLDNMFLSMPGGIVTAPVLQRTDAGNTPTINAPINMSILQDDADRAMAGNIRWMASESVKNAVVNVTPSGMGPISVQIGIEKDQMNVSIVALQGATREALDLLVPRLREQLVAQGHDNVRVDISDGKSEQSDRGYDQQFSDQQAAKDKSEDHLMTASVANPDAESRQEQSAVGAVSQGGSLININGQVSGRYDVYV